jgi:hypothetical protein
VPSNICIAVAYIKVAVSLPTVKVQGFWKDTLKLLSCFLLDQSEGQYNIKLPVSVAGKPAKPVEGVKS